MPEFPGITHVALTVTDLGRSRPWYEASSAVRRSSMRTLARITMWCGCWAGRRWSGSIVSPIRTDLNPLTNADRAWTILRSRARTGPSSSNGSPGSTSWALPTEASLMLPMVRASHSVTRTTSPWSSSRRPGSRSPDTMNKVDYDSSARLYSQGRGLTTDAQASWQEAVAVFVGPVPAPSSTSEPERASSRGLGRPGADCELRLSLQRPSATRLAEAVCRETRAWSLVAPNRYRSSRASPISSGCRPWCTTSPISRRGRVRLVGCSKGAVGY